MLKGNIMRLFIAEKPDLAKAIGASLDGTQKKGDGYFIKGNDVVTWAFGHILELYKPEDYDESLRRWDFAALPIKIDEFKYKPIEGSKKQLKIICALINSDKITQIINCGDADEEGQILIDEILSYSGTGKKIYRLMLQDLTEKGIRAQLKNIRPNSDFKGLSECGFSRAQADWLVGINLTRAYTKIAQEKGYNDVLSVGRVQTPILGLIVNRDVEHENHKASFYYTISAAVSTQGLTIPMRYKSDEKIIDESFANAIGAKVRNKNGLITKATHETRNEFPPLPYNLLLLQADCSKKFGYKPDKTLQITQSLREKHKAITYNRSDCQYLPENLFEQCSEILNYVGQNLPSLAQLTNGADPGIKSSAFNDKNITAHYAIIPTATKVTNLSLEEQNVYELIAKRFTAIFYPPQEFIQTDLEATVDGEKFIASAKKVIKQGYKTVFDKDEADDEIKPEEEVAMDLTALEQGREAICKEVKISKQQTRPKPYYTMATLLKDLTAVSKYVKDERIKKLLQEKDKDKKGENGGIGTPATRSEHIKKLFDRGFVAEKSKNIVSTELGRNFFALAPQILTKPDMTALWFEEQKEIVSGRRSREEFLRGINQIIAEEISKIKFNGVDVTKLMSNAPKCPKCGSLLVRHENKGKKGAFWWGCSNYKNCDLGFLADNKGKPVLQNAPKPQPKSAIKCPKCGKGILISYKNKSKKDGKPYTWFGCSEYKNGCNFKCFADSRGNPKF